MKSFAIAIFLVFILSFAGCASKGQITTKEVTKKEQIYSKTFKTKDTNSTSLNSENLNIKNKFLLTKYLGTKTGYDCSSFVSIINSVNSNIFYKESDVSKFYDRSGRKSKAIYNLYANKNKISFKPPDAGDLIFFANTLGDGVKANKDKKNITHIGIVTQVFKDGTIEFAHYIKDRVKNSYMNLKYKNIHIKDGKEINSFIIRCKSKSASCLTSNRFAGFGKVEYNSGE